MGTDVDDDGTSWDTDGDGVLDGYECAHGSNPRDAASIPAALADDAADDDGDGLANGWERRGWGTDISVVDTNSDGAGDCKSALDVNDDGVVNFAGDTIRVARREGDGGRHRGVVPQQRDRLKPGVRDDGIKIVEHRVEVDGPDVAL